MDLCGRAGKVCVVGLAALAAAEGFMAPPALGAVAAARGHSSRGPLMGLKNTEGKAPIINLFDERAGCARESKEYTGKKTGGVDDAMCLKVYMDKIEWSEGATQQVMAELIPQLSPAVRRAKGIIK
mmetsp:Transcript_7338/g.18307  ORF Transcript_7338/g.18307 Transcript_7338/m.18307 type:complete len:126 (-) Transcript_7338:904-1281(-)